MITKDYLVKNFIWRVDNSGQGVKCIADIPYFPFKDDYPKLDDKTVSESFRADNIRWPHHESVFIIEKKCVVEPRNLLAISGLNKLIGVSIFFPDLRPSIKQYLKYRLGLNNSPKTTFSKAIIFAGPGGANYFHFFTDIINKLWLFEKYGIDPATPILISEDVYQKKYFQYIHKNFLAGRFNFQLVKPDMFVEVENLVLVNPMAFDKPLWQKTIGLFENVRSKEIPSKRIFLSRSKKSGRWVSNFNEILPVLNKWNFEVIDTDILEFEDQVKIFSETKYLVALHGAGETNIMFSQPQHLHLLELNPHNRIVSYFYWLSKMLGVKYYNCLLGGDVLTVNVKPEPGFEINPVELDKAIAKMITIPLS